MKMNHTSDVVFKTGLGLGLDLGWS